MSAPRRGRSGSRSRERRRNHALREVLDEFIAEVRTFASEGGRLSPHESSYLVERLEWLTEEIIRLASQEPGPR